MPVKKIRKLVKRTLKPRKEGVAIDPQELQAASAYVQRYWSKLEKTNITDKGSLIGLPHRYLVPASGGEEFSFEEQYYWDSYFTVLGLMQPEDEELVEGMLNNLLHQLDRFGLIPNASRMYFVGRSQPPLLTSYIFHIYETYGRSEAWLAERIQKAQKEYTEVWMSTQHPHWRNVHKGLSRYYDINVLHDLAEAESGWDMTTRFRRKCLDYLPIDLNSLLYKYETDFAKAARILGNEQEAQKWDTAAKERQKAVTDTMWNERQGYFYDYNYVSKQKSSVNSLAGFYALWSGLATESQAKKIVKKLDEFEHRGGVSTTIKPVLDVQLFGSVKAQWAHPNGWAPLHYFVIEGLERYGYTADAERIARKWLRTNVQWFTKHGEFLEKYNVVSPHKPPVEGVYPSQSGFGWTNGVFTYLLNKYAEKPAP
jgi:alpha,alpha-trehalase